MKYDVLVSCSRKDVHVAQALYRALCHYRVPSAFVDEVKNDVTVRHVDRFAVCPLNGPCDESVENSGCLVDLAQGFDEENNAKLRGRLRLPSLELNLVFRLSISGLDVFDQVLSHVWDGRDFTLQYAIHVDGNCACGAKTAELLVFGQDLPLGKIAFVVNVVERKSINASARANILAHAYRHYFVSYSKLDFSAVADRIQGIQLVEREITQHMFFDKMFLKPGERYEKTIYDYIDNKADVFLLFWSENAKSSEWVRKEYQRALACQQKSNGLPDIIPVPLEMPPPEPPEELSHLHFNDVLMLVKEGASHRHVSS